MTRPEHTAETETGRPGGQPPRLYLVAGEPSGDQLGARLIASLCQRARDRGEPEPEFSGIGGERMAEQGFTSLFPIADLAVMGLLEVLPHIRVLKRRMRQTTDDILARQPDLVITIDSPGFTKRVVKQVRDRQTTPLTIAHYVAPTVWAWKPGRAAKMAALFDHLLVLLPFEPPWFEKEGLPTRFVGHPVAATPVIPAEELARSREAFTGQPAGQDGKVILLLPGSRKGEVRKLLPVFRETLERLQDGLQQPLTILLPTVGNVAELVQEAVADWKFPVRVIRDAGEKARAFQVADVALAASGTVALETAIAGTPTVVGYRLNALTYQIVRRMVKVQWVSLVNLLLQRSVIPECLQHDCTPEKLSGHLLTLLQDPAAAEDQKAAFRDAKAMLHPDGLSPEDAAAVAVEEILAGRP